MRWWKANRFKKKIKKKKKSPAPRAHCKQSTHRLYKDYIQ